MYIRASLAGVIASWILCCHCYGQAGSTEGSVTPKLVNWFDASPSVASRLTDAPLAEDSDAFRVAAYQAQIAAQQSGAAGATPRVRPPASQRRSLLPSRGRPARSSRSLRQPSRFAVSGGSRRPSPAQAAGFISLATVPYMIGDTASGSCASVSFRGALDGNIEHPTLACSRLNVSENNTAMLTDRFYVSYRHFHNVSETSLFEQANDLSVDRVMFGIEKTYFDGSFSAELRVPISRELSSNFDIVLNTANPALDTLPLNDRAGEFGNISVILKKRLLQSRRFMLSGGLGVQLPTGDDVNARGDLDGDFFIIDDLVPALDAFVDLEFSVRVQNETVNLSPFLAWLWAPTERCFHQGFLQIDVPMNPSDASGDFEGQIDPVLVPGGALASIPVNVSNTGKLHQQTLLRLNLGLGYRFYHDPTSDWLRAISGMVELHYTTTLQDSKLFTTPLFAYDYLGNALPVDFTLGNGANRMDIVNAAFGNSIQVGKTIISNGFVVPVSTGDNKAFDAEYNFQLQRQY